MATQLQIRRGTAAQVAAFTGAEGEIVYNSTNDSLHTNDGATAGGFELARADLNNVSDADLNAALTGNTLSALTITTLTSGAATFSGPIQLTAGALAAAGNAGLSHRSADNKVYLQAGTGGFNILDDQQNTQLAIASTGAATFSSTVTGTQFSSTSSSAALPSFGVTAGNGMYNPATNSIGWSTNSVERLRLDSGGNLGVGTSSPSAKVNIDMAVAGDSGASSATRNLLLLQTSGTQATAGTLKVDGIIHPSVYKINIDSSTGAGAAAPLSFSTANGATETMRIDASGNLGIGTSSPSTYAKFAIRGGLTVNAGSTSLTGVSFSTSDAANSTFWINHASGTTNLITDVPMAFYTASGSGVAEAMRISSGNLLVGNSAFSGSSYVCQIEADGTIDIGTAITTIDHRIQFFNPNGFVGSISTSGSATSYNTSSDYRLKQDDVQMTGATERVKALRPINFAWKVDGSRTDGFFAHEAQEVVPECSTGTKDAMRDEEYEVTPAVEEVKDEDGNVTTEAIPAVMGTRSVPDYQGIDQSKLVPLLTAALQEAIAKIEDLTARLEALEGA